MHLVLRACARDQRRPTGIPRMLVPMAVIVQRQQGPMAFKGQNKDARPATTPHRHSHSRRARGTPHSALLCNASSTPRPRTTPRAVAQCLRHTPTPTRASIPTNHTSSMSTPIWPEHDRATHSGFQRPVRAHWAPVRAQVPSQKTQAYRSKVQRSRLVLGYKAAITALSTRRRC
jgi:hypothetical protein